MSRYNFVFGDIHKNQSIYTVKGDGQTRRLDKTARRDQTHPRWECVRLGLHSRLTVS